jgi:uncharacterized protein YaaQ
VKLIVAVIHNRDRTDMCDALVDGGFKSTVIGSSGGFLREGNATLLIGVDDAQVPEVMALIGRICPARDQILNVTSLEAASPGSFLQSPISAPVGGAVVFVLDVEQFLRF